MRSTKSLFNPITHLWDKLWNPKYISRKTREVLLIVVATTIILLAVLQFYTFMMVFVLRNVTK
jgi:hypothetical protein